MEKAEEKPELFGNPLFLPMGYSKFVSFFFLFFFHTNIPSTRHTASQGLWLGEMLQ